MTETEVHKEEQPKLIPVYPEDEHKYSGLLGVMK